MSHPPFVKSFISLFAKGVVNRFIPKEALQGLFWLIFSLVTFIFFLTYFSIGLFDVLRLFEVPAWAASLLLAAVYLLAFIALLSQAKRALLPKKQSAEDGTINANELVGAFLDGLFNRPHK